MRIAKEISSLHVLRSRSSSRVDLLDLDLGSRSS